MITFLPPVEEGGDIVESSDDVGANVLDGVDEEGDSVDDSSDDDDEDIADIGEEAGKAEEQEANPFFDGSDSGSGVSDTDDDDEEEADAGGSKEPVDEEDELIKALKAAREKKVRNCPPDIKTTEMVTDVSFHPEADLVALGSMTGELSVFR